MKSERLYAAIGAADDELLIRCEAEIKKPQNTWIKFSGLAACAAAVLLFCVWTIPGLLNSPITPGFGDTAHTGSPDNPATFDPGDTAHSGSPDNPVTFDPDDTALIGLPAGDFSLAGLHNPSEAAADRMVRVRITDFFSNGAPDMVVFVRVIGTEQWTYKDSHTIYASERQTSTAHILSTVWSGVEAPETISIMQSKYGGCCADEETNLLRNGGVYMLPLRYWEGEGVWIIDGDLDVLFEVDDKGRVWSHSAFEEFNRYDGSDTGVLADSITITALTSDENFPAAITMFGRIASGWGRLTEVTVLTVTHSVSEYGYNQVEYRMRADNILLIASNPAFTWQPEIGGEFTAISHGKLEYLEQGGRYLVHLDPSESGPYIEDARAAIINADGTITAIPCQNDWQKNIFAEYDGYTVAQMAEEAERANAWHERYAN
ncbi:MAG: hypothetical protein FWH06_07640 [Oscillospiraceae bacterium]|nr:hypothetical protein [Oscillospiraceae bacterium]